MSVMNILTTVVPRPVPAPVWPTGPMKPLTIEDILYVAIPVNIIAAIALLAWVIILKKRGHKLNAGNIFDPETEPWGIGAIIWLSIMFDIAVTPGLLVCLIKEFLL